MKKALYGTTALVAAGALMSSPASAEEGIKLGLGGYFHNYFAFGATDNDTSGVTEVDRNATGIFSDGEVYFLGSTTLDNGITFGANIQLETLSATGSNNARDDIDEAYMYMEGNFGRVNIGSENTAAYLMHYAAPYVGAGVNSGWLTTFVPNDSDAALNVRRPSLSTNVDIGNDNAVITYFSPRFSGFQVGVTYIPGFEGTGTGDPQTFPIQVDTETQYNNSWAIGANFVESFEGIDIAVSGGFRRAEDSDAAAGVASEDWDQTSFGVNVGFAGFTVGGSWADQDSDNTVDGDDSGWDAGVSYSTGPWSIGLTYFTSDTENTAGADSEVDAFNGGISYAVGPGISAKGGVIYGDYEGPLADSDGTMGYAGISLSF